MASGPDQPPAGPSRLADSLARHRWVAAAGMTATIAAVAGGGLALALHDSSAGAAEGVRSGALRRSAARVGADQRGRVSQRARHGRSHGRPARAHAVLAGSLPHLSRTVGGGSRRRRPRRRRPRPDQPASAGRVSVPEPRSSCTTVIAFIAGDSLSPVRCRFTDAARHQRGRDGSGHPGYGAAGQDTRRAGGQPGSGQGGHDDWLSGWLSRGWSGGGWSGVAGRWRLVRWRLVRWRLVRWRLVRAARRLAWRPVTVPQALHDAR